MELKPNIAACAIGAIGDIAPSMHLRNEAAKPTFRLPTSRKMHLFVGNYCDSGLIKGQAGLYGQRYLADVGL